jgi:rubrerythrin
MLKIALSTARSQYEFYRNTAEDSEMEEVKALLMHLAESESRMKRYSI